MRTDYSDEEILERAGIHLTANRLLIWRAIRHQFADAFSLADLEARLLTIDRSTIFRTLTLFGNAHLLHEIDDGTGTQKYCVCHVDDTRRCLGHVHLTCRICHHTYCLPDVEIPPVPLPEGFQPEEAEYVVKGVCANCSLSNRVRN